MTQPTPEHTTLASWLDAFSRAIAAGNVDDIVALFGGTCFWRDLVAFTWDIRTLEGRDAIRAMLDATLASIRPHEWAVAEPVRAGATDGFISFDTALGRCDGYVRLDAQGRCLTLLTALRELKGFEEPTRRRRVSGHEQPLANVGNFDAAKQPYVLIVGGGHGGLSIAARLKLLGVPALIVDRHARTGDSWRSRYPSLQLHDPVWSNHLPYLSFPDHWPVFAAKDKVGDWLESYARIMELDIWHRASCVGAQYDPASGQWRARIVRGGHETLLQPTHLVFATGLSGDPFIPSIPGAASFAGMQCHSSAYAGGERFSGRKVVVFGSNNSAHDICEELLAHGADVTMIQRSSTHVIRQPRVLEIMRSLYSEEAVARGLDAERADLQRAALPMRMLPVVFRPTMEKIAREDDAFYQRLAAAGFRLDFGEDGAGIVGKYLRKGGGYYIDTGASELIANGRIKLKSGVQALRIERSCVVLSDGSRVDADDIVYATGFRPMNEVIAKLISPQVAAAIGRVYGYGSGLDGDPGPWEGELRNMWKPTRQPGLWFHGGNFQMARFHSKFLALQLKARFEGLAVSVFQP
ncbi:flavin-containing monooxygenase [Paraburkholderia rhizosphaerae]|uniref:Putative flavoprotein involved in K+ transport n=1 Tax=Paraburkholderia rhizosphaerae TaxID=480658 RepID=A0A4R8LM36_9BURK|nr:NAD(P)/FAD-dependent oxidoreductase [Paraburkholderia rhizosphaerae]TDY44427.1 putative flavoprotein involved in K+ transport [Paraburkholderia rhizosphaerae]